MSPLAVLSRPDIETLMLQQWFTVTDSLSQYVIFNSTSLQLGVEEDCVYQWPDLPVAGVPQL
jgi:hypothetical protein